MKIIKLVSYSLSAGMVLSLFLPPAYAEFYEADCHAPVIHCAEPVHVRPPCFYRHHRHHCHHRRHHHYCHEPYPCYAHHEPCGCADVSVYYVWNSVPHMAECGDYCRHWSHCPSTVYHVPPCRAYYYGEEWDYSVTDFDFDRRTADDITSEMDIDL